MPVVQTETAQCICLHGQSSGGAQCRKAATMNELFCDRCAHYACVCPCRGCQPVAAVPLQPSACPVKPTTLHKYKCDQLSQCISKPVLHTLPVNLKEPTTVQCICRRSPMLGGEHCENQAPSRHGYCHECVGWRCLCLCPGCIPRSEDLVQHKLQQPQHMYSYQRVQRQPSCQPVVHTYVQHATIPVLEKGPCTSKTRSWPQCQTTPFSNYSSFPAVGPLRSLPPTAGFSPPVGNVYILPPTVGRLSFSG